MLKHKRTLLIAAGLLAVIVFIVLRIASSRDPESTTRTNVPLVRTERPARDTVIYDLRFTGDLAAITQANIFSKVSGNLERVYADIGAYVHAGQLLALIDTTELRQQYLQMAATFENARVTYERSKELSTQNLISKQEVDNNQTALAVARASFDLAATRLSYARITAPFSGLITRRFLDPGALVNPASSVLFTLMDIARIKVLVNVLEKDLPLVHIGTKASIGLDSYPGRKFEGTVTRMGGSLDLATRTMAVEIDIPNPAGLLKPGMYANVSMLLDTHLNALTLPTQSILKDEKGSFIYVAAGNSAKRIPVTTGAEMDLRTEVLSGLRGDEQVITTGQQFVKPNGPIRISAR